MSDFERWLLEHGPGVVFVLIILFMFTMPQRWRDRLSTPLFRGKKKPSRDGETGADSE